MQRSNIAALNLFVVAVFVLAGPLAVPSPAINISLHLEPPGENPAWDPDGSILLSIFEAAASYWEPIFVDSRSITVDIEWDDDLDWTTLGLWTYDPVGNNNIEINSNRAWWVDPTPYASDEFNLGQRLYEDLSPTQRTDWFNGPVPNVLEVGWRGNATPGSGVGNNVDLLTICTHELGHELGVRSDVGPVFPFYAHQVGGAIGVEVQGVPGSGHLAAEDALMWTSFSLGERALPSATDSLAVAHAAGYTTLSLPRTEFINVNNDFNNPLNWIGGMSGVFNDAAVRHGSSTVNATASADMSFVNLTLMEDSWVSTGSHTLEVAQTLTIDAAGAATEARLSVDAGGTVEAYQIRLLNGGDIVMYGGLVAVGRLEVVGPYTGQFAMVPGATLRVDRLIGFGNSLQFAGNVQIGDTGPDSGLLEIGTNQSLWVLGTMTVGPSPGGAGTVTVYSGGQADTGPLQIGTNNVSGVVTVSGYDTNLGVLSDWDVNGDLTIGSTSRGAGTMTAQLLATVDVTGAATVRGSSDAPGRLIVKSGASFEVDHNLNILRFGSVAVSDAGSEIVADEIALSPGGSFSDGPGTIVRANRLSGFGNNVAFSGSLEIGHPGGLATHTVGAGQSLDVTERFTIGRDAPGTLNIHSGGTVESGRSFLATEFSAAGSSVTVSGPGSRWDVLENLYVGGTELVTGGAAALTLMDSGQLEVDGLLSVLPGSLVTVGDSSTAGTLTAKDTLRIYSGGTLSVGPAGNLYANTIDLTGGGNLATTGPNSTVFTNGIIGLGSNLSINGNLGVGWSGGSGVGNLTLINGQSLSVSGVLYLGANASGTLSLVNGATAEIGQARIGDNGGSGTLVVYRTNSVVNQNGSFYIGYFSTGSTGSMRIENGGAVLGNNHDAFLAAGAGTTGTVLVDGLDARWIDIGSLYVGGDAMGPAGNATLTVSRGGRVAVNGTLQVWSTGRVELLGSEISARSFVVATGGTFQHDDGTLTVNGGPFVPGASGNYTIDGPSPAEQPTVVLTGAATASIPQTLFVGFDHRGKLRIENGATLNSFNGRVGWSTGTSQGGVTVDGTTSRWTNAADLEIGVRNYGQLTISGGGRVENTIGAIAAVAGSFGDVIVSGGSTWANSGSLYVGGRSAPGGTGTLIVAAGAEVTAADATVWPQGLIKLDNADLRAANVSLVGGRLEGIGNVLVDGQFSNAGVVSPGESPGTISINNGNYVQTDAGTLAIDLGGVHAGEFDRLEIHHGSAALAGGLQVSLFGDFVPQVGNMFEILWAENSLSGAFDPLLTVLPSLPGRQWNLIQQRGTVTLEVLSAMLAGDFNQNGTVDAADYVVWREGLGTTYTQDDYNTWRAHFGQTPSAGWSAGGGTSLVATDAPAATAEPATLWLMCLAIVSLIARRPFRHSETLNEMSEA